MTRTNYKKPLSPLPMVKPKKRLPKEERREARKTTDKARRKVLTVARRKGVISSIEAQRIGGWSQAWFHLNAMAEAGELKHVGFNQWLPTPKKRKKKRAST
jgi:hypothetical protein